MKTYEQMFRHVQDYLMATGCDGASKSSGYPFRKRSDHIRRVFLWAGSPKGKPASIPRPF